MAKAKAKPQTPNPVQGFLFQTVSEEHQDRNQTICQIVRRLDEQNPLEFGCAFMVRFGDGHEMTAYASELSPWYPT